MNILILEDNETKLNVIKNVLNELELELSITESDSMIDFVGKVNREKFDLIVADLVLPIFGNNVNDEPADVTTRLIEAIRDYDSHNLQTPVIAVTQFNTSAEDNFVDLNKHDINVITYSEDIASWKDAFIRKVQSCIPKLTYDFVIICALEKEAESYCEAGYISSKRSVKFGLSCREIQINHKNGVIVVPPRMGLVNAAIASARSIDLFEPKIICMSGICAGIEGKADIYDIVIPSLCDQHDSGKWTSDGFVAESYSVQLQHETEVEIDQIIKGADFLESVADGVILEKSEMPGESSVLDVKIYTAPTSSGSSVVADESMLEQITAQHRKKTAFEMESYALYEASRQSLHNPLYFSAKSVVDNGDKNKGDEFHRVAALISAKAVHGILEKLLK